MIITILRDFPRHRSFLCRKYLSQIDSTAIQNLFVSRENAKKMRFSLSDSTANPEASRRGKREKTLDLFGYTFPRVRIRCNGCRAIPEGRGKGPIS